MFQRAKYKEHADVPWHSLPNPVATRKRDGGHDFMQVTADGSLKFFSRRPSVKGGFPEHTEKLPHLTDRKLPELAGHVYSVELVHSGFDKDAVESHPKLSGILNSLPSKSVQTQKETGPVRAVLLDVINPPLPTYQSKLLHMKEVEQKFGKPDLMFVEEPVIDTPGIVNLINKTKREGREGVIVTSLTLPEEKNPRIKIKHKNTLNLRVNRILQEYDKNGNPKPSMGALELTDASGRVVGKVGTGFDHPTRKEIWEHPQNWIGKPVQVVARNIVKQGGMLIQPVYNGLADGDIDLVT